VGTTGDTGTEPQAASSSSASQILLALFFSSALVGRVLRLPGRLWLQHRWWGVSGVRRERCKQIRRWL